MTGGRSAMGPHVAVAAQQVEVAEEQRVGGVVDDIVLVGPVEADDGDTALDLEQYGIFVRHRTPLPL
jgi:hypothetical protein